MPPQRTNFILEQQHKSMISLLSDIRDPNGSFQSGQSYLSSDVPDIEFHMAQEYSFDIESNGRNRRDRFLET